MLASMTPPIKKRQIEMEDHHDGDSYSEPSFDSPASDEDYDDDDYQAKAFDFDEDGDQNVVGKSFQAPILESQESSWNSPGLGTQPIPMTVRTRTPVQDQQQHNRPAKKRKVSLSPTDSLAHRRTPQRHESTKKAQPKLKSTQSKNTQPSQNTVDTLIEDLDGDQRVSEKSKAKATKKSAMKTEKDEDAAIKTKKNRKITTKGVSKATESSIEPNSTTRKDRNELKGKKTKAQDEVEAHAPDALLTTPTKKTKKTTSEVSKRKMSPTKPSASNSDSAGKPPSSTSNPPLPAKKTTTTKKKKKKRSFQDDLLESLFMSCKPHTIKALAQQLKTNEASINFCMLSLVDKGWVIKKEFTSKSGNRSKELYWANQESKSKELMDTLQMVPPNEIRQAREELAQLQQQHTSVTQELATVMSKPSNVELNAQFQALEQEVQELENNLQASHARIRAAQQGGPKTTKVLGATHSMKVSSKRPVVKPAVSSKRLKKRINNMRLHWKKRKEKCIDFIEQLADGMEKKVKDVIKILEIETDEMIGVKIPPKHDDV